MREHEPSVVLRGGLIREIVPPRLSYVDLQPIFGVNLKIAFFYFNNYKLKKM